MTMTQLQHKQYQEDALEALEKFLQRSRTLVSAAQAFREVSSAPYVSAPFGEAVPCVCFRIPTGGGKTVLAARAIERIAKHYGGGDAPVVIWLAPSDTIVSQTFDALADPQHPYHRVLAARYGDRLTVCRLSDAAQIPVQDWGRRAIIIVATMQSFNVENTEGRRVYAFSETFENHFKSKSEFELRILKGIDRAVVSEADLAENEERRKLLAAYLGKPKKSLANWLALHTPIVIVDEAHNAKTEKSFVTLTRLNPSAVLDLTATPVQGSSNVVYHVGAQQLQSENMIKMPIMLTEHKEGWQQAVLAAIHTRGGLADAAEREQQAGGGYIRPIVLFQATNENGEVPAEKLREHLINELNVPAEQIAVATGKTRELEDIEIASPSCPILYVITVQALREGWDCPFAYVLCSLQNLSSATAIEQLLGRVLRMPYATARGEPALNRAYAHVSERDTRRAAMILADKLVTNMGFDPLDVASLMARPADPVSTAFSGGDWSTRIEDIAATIENEIEVPLAVKAELPAGFAVTRVEGESNAKLLLKGVVSEEEKEGIVNAVRGAAAKDVARRQIEQHMAIVASATSPSHAGIAFPSLPRLAFRDTPDAPLLTLDREVVVEEVELDLSNHSATDIGRFDIVAEPDAFEIFTDDGGHVRTQRADPAQIPLNYGSSQLTSADIARWLDAMLFRDVVYLTQMQRYAYCLRVVERLVNERNQSIGQLAQARYALAKRVMHKIEDIRTEACRKGFKQLVLDEGWTIAVDYKKPFEFGAGNYPVSPLTQYRGRHRFSKHYYPSAAALKSEGEEFQCALEIDSHPLISMWIRNIDYKPGFSLPTSKQNFYPDFIAKLIDGRVAVIEYKGKHLRDLVDEVEKREIGHLWARKSEGKFIFSMVYVKGDRGETMKEQLNAIFAK